jgi:hypothetical protein
MSDSSENVTVEISETPSEPIEDNSPAHVQTDEVVDVEIVTEVECQSEESPVEETPTEETVVEETTTEEAVVEETTTEETPVEETPAEEAVNEEAPTEEAVAEEPAAETSDLSVELITADSPETNELPLEQQTVSEMPVPVHEPVDIVPKYIFIVPYRDREQQLTFFKKHMSFVLEDVNPADYKMFFIHQQDSRSFNRGAMKNIGFLYVKSIYPNDYQNITLVFNDVDTMPYTKNFFDYSTKPGTIKHFYGFKYALGGIISVNALDFERINGFPNFWAWGYEDNLIQKRALNAGLFIDRTNFYPLMDKNVFQMKDGLERLVNRTEFDKFLGLTLEGISNIQNLSLEYNDDNKYVNVKNFTTGTEDVQSQSVPYSLTQGNKPFGNVYSGNRGRARMPMHF